MVRMKRYLDSVPGAISGENGHEVTSRVARHLIEVFLLTVDEALPLLAQWNRKCDPPWAEGQLRSFLVKAEDAAAETTKRDASELKFIVAEVTTNWPKPWPVPAGEMLSGQFELVIEHNRRRGYRLHSFQVSRLMTGADQMNETIIAVFEKEQA